MPQERLLPEHRARDVLAALGEAAFEREHAAGHAASLDELIESFPERNALR